VKGNRKFHYLCEKIPGRAGNDGKKSGMTEKSREGWKEAGKDGKKPGMTEKSRE